MPEFNIPLRDIWMICSPFIAFSLGLYSAQRLDRGRARLSVVGAISEIRDDIESSNDIESTHSSSIAFLKPKVFGALALLGRRKQNKARQAWKAYRTLNFDEFPKLLFIQKVFSKPSPKEGMGLALQALMDAFK